MHTESEYQRLLKDYLYNQSQKKHYEEIEKSIKEKIFEMMKNEGVDTREILHPETEVKYTCGYGSRSFQSTDYDLLLETVGENQFNQIVERKESIFPIIKKAPKKKISPIDKNNVLSSDDPFKPKPLMGQFDNAKLA